MKESLGVENTKVLVVRPLGGLNDVLCQIEYARKLSASANRKFAIQTEVGNVGLTHRFAETFDSLFRFVDNTQVLQPQELESLLSRATTILPEEYESPSKFLETTLEAVTEGKLKRFRLKPGGYDRYDVVVHESGGGGPLGAILLGRVVFSEKFLKRLHDQIKILPINATGIHFRNSDYKSRPELLKRFIQRVPKRESILLASDDKDIRSFLSTTTSNRQIILANECFSDTSTFTKNELALAELYLLSLCKNLVLVPLSTEHRTRYSGFGRLAKQVWAVRKLRTEGVISFALSATRFLGLGRRKSKKRSLESLLGSINSRFVISQWQKPSGVYLQAIEFWRLNQKP